MNKDKLGNDAPITKPGQDRLGFGILARHLADAFLHNDLSRGLVIGIEGPWGSGKSSLANLALDMLKKEKDEPVIVRFSPWIVGHRSELLRELFLEFDSAICDTIPATASRARIRTLLRKHAWIEPALSAAGDAATSVGLPLVGTVSQAVKDRVSTVANPSLGALNRDLRQQFGKLGRTVVVFIDDIDRLEPPEAVEVLRLIRAVADFPKVAYLLAYDPGHLARCLESELGIDNGQGYIEKIVQASFKIPSPIGLDLRNWLRDAACSIIGEVDLTHDEKKRLNSAVDLWCDEYISTPRDIVRVSNALKLYVKPVIREVDMADAIFVQVTRIFHPEFHDWIEQYVESLSLTTFLSSEDEWSGIDQEDSGSSDSRLADIVNTHVRKKTHGRNASRFLNRIRNHLPLVTIPDDKAKQEERVALREQRSAGRRRLYRQENFRFYFAFLASPGFVSREYALEFLKQCESDPERGACEFRRRCEERRPQGGIMAQVLLDRIVEQKTIASNGQIQALLFMLGKEMDHFAREGIEQNKAYCSLPGSVDEIIGLIGNFDTVRKEEILEELSEQKSSLILLNEVFIKAVIEHGHSDGKESEQKFLSKDEYEYVRDRLRERLKAADAHDIKNMPYFRQLMYGWYFADKKGAKAWMERQCSDDQAFVHMLDRMKHKHPGRSYFLSPTQHMLLDPISSAVRRLECISSNTDYGDELRNTAKALIPVIEGKTNTE